MVNVNDFYELVNLIVNFLQNFYIVGNFSLYSATQLIGWVSVAGSSLATLYRVFSSLSAQ